jgi:ArsR family transcriptional regulator
MDYMTDRRLYKLHAGICHTLAHPKRLEIIDKLRSRELSVSELVRALEISQGNLSQHLAIMRQRGIVLTRREGLNVFYRLSSPKITRACDLMRQVLLEHLEDSTRAVARTFAGKRAMA